MDCSKCSFSYSDLVVASVQNKGKGVMPQRLLHARQETERNFFSRDTSRATNEQSHYVESSNHPRSSRPWRSDPEAPYNCPRGQETQLAPAVRAALVSMSPFAPFQK